ncbi:MAG: PIN domain-containing protein [Solobacterium sp.]|nr:PIN domain-containing protein [Solobacterium sp.]
MNNLLDANAILRYLLNDIEEQAETVEKAIKNGAYTIPEVMAEVVYVLSGVYECERKEIADTIRVLLDEIDISDKPVILSALDLFGSTNLDYVDCILVARAVVLNENVLTFDKKLTKQILKKKDK